MGAGHARRRRIQSDVRRRRSTPHVDSTPDAFLPSRDRVALYAPRQPAPLPSCWRPRRTRRSSSIAISFPKSSYCTSARRSGVLLCIGTRRKFSLTGVDLLLAAFLVASVLSAAFSTNRWLAERAVAISLSGAALFWVAGTLRRAGLARAARRRARRGRGDRRGYVARAGLWRAKRVFQPQSLAGRHVWQSQLRGAPRGHRSAGDPAGDAHGAAWNRCVCCGAVGMAVIAAVLVLSRSRAGWLAVIASATVAGLLAVLTRDRWTDARADAPIAGGRRGGARRRRGGGDRCRTASSGRATRPISTRPPV